MLDRNVLRLGGGAAMIGAVIGLVFNILHPRTGEDIDSVRAHLDLVADKGIWVFDHFMLAWSLAFAAIALVAIGWSFRDAQASAWGRFATASAIVGIAVGFVLLVVDGPAVKSVAESVAENPGNEAVFATGRAVVEVAEALFTGLMGSLFGLTPVLYGIALLSTDQYPRWLAYAALLSGALGLIAGSLQYLDGISTLTAEVLFPISSLLFTVWIFVMGWQLWRGEEVAMARSTGTA